MPQLTLEYTDNIKPELDFQDFLDRLHHLLADAAGTRIENFKSRIVCRDTYRIGDGLGRGAFIHLELRLLAGRSPETKDEIGQRCLSLLEETWGPYLAGLDPQITVELVDMERDSYYKWPPGSL